MTCNRIAYANIWMNMVMNKHYGWRYSTVMLLMMKKLGKSKSGTSLVLR